MILPLCWVIKTKVKQRELETILRGYRRDGKDCAVSWEVGGQDQEYPILSGISHALTTKTPYEDLQTLMSLFP
jgi:hypothetical protein